MDRYYDRSNAVPLPCDSVGCYCAQDKIFKEAVDYSINKLHAKRIEIHAQTYVKDLYKEFGFVEVNEPFYEAGIEHIKMVLEK